MSSPCLHEHDWGVLDEWRKETSDKLDRILHQAIKTNGRIKALEHWRTVLMTCVATILLTKAGSVGDLVEMVRGWL